MKQKVLKAHQSKKLQKKWVVIISSLTVGLALLVGIVLAHPQFQRPVLGVQTSNVTANRLVTVTPSLSCDSCAAFYHKQMAIVLQKDGKNSKNWGAQCVPAASLKNNHYKDYVLCPIPTITPTPKVTLTPSPVALTGRIVVNIVNSKNQFSTPPVGNTVKVYASNSPLTVSLLGMIDSNSQGWAGSTPVGTDSIIAYPTSTYGVTFASCTSCTTVPSTFQGGNSFMNGLAYFPSILLNQEVDVFVKFTAK